MPSRADTALDYLAPEMLTTGVYDHRIDVWALGILTYEYRRLRMPDDDNTWSPGAF